MTHLATKRSCHDGYCTDVQIDLMRSIVEDEKKKFWGNVAARMRKTAKGCERIAKEQNIQVFSN